MMSKLRIACLAAVVAGLCALVPSESALAASADPTAATAASWKRCGYIGASPRGRFKVTKKGSVSCRGARKLMHLFLNERQGSKRGGPYGYNTYWVLYGWKCGTGAGGGGCKRRGARTLAEWVP